MRISQVYFALVVATGCVNRHPPPAPSITGTYEITVCKLGSCSLGDTTQAVTYGTLVLFASALPPVPDSALPLLDSFHGEANACFAVHPPHDEARTYAGLMGVGATIWQTDSTPAGRRLRFSLYDSPDAAHRVVAELTQGRIAGRGESWGAGVAAVDYAPDTVVGRRIGPPDITPCVAASVRAWREIRTSRPPPNER